MSLWLFVGPLFALIGLAMGSGEASAAQPEPWQLNFQPAASPVMEQVESLHDLLLWIITLVVLMIAVAAWLQQWNRVRLTQEELQRVRREGERAGGDRGRRRRRDRQLGPHGVRLRRDRRRRP